MHIWEKSPLPHLSLDAAGLVSLADLSTVNKRTALTGTGSYLDTLIICPGLHRQQAAPDLNSGEYPAVGALTSGYVFRVENPATVVYLQKVGRTAQLTNLKVSKLDNKAAGWRSIANKFLASQNATIIAGAAYILATLLTITSFILLGLAADYWGLVVLSVLVFARFLNTWVIRQRALPGWHGEPEPGIYGDLLVLMSQDRWLRIQGLVDDLKTVTAGQWLKEQTFLQSSLSAVATVLVYLDAALASNVDTSGKLLLFVLLILSAGLLAIANERTEAMLMHGCKIEMSGERKAYDRRLDLAEALLKEPGRNDQAMRGVFSQMGITVPVAVVGSGGGKIQGKVTM